jgi:hypothetical protein
MCRTVSSSVGRANTDSTVKSATHRHRQRKEGRMVIVDGAIMSIASYL